MSSSLSTPPSSSSSAAVIQTVLNYKEVLEKEIAKSNIDSTIDVERCNDILEQLQPTHMKMTYTILNETLIGVTVNKLKSNVTLQSKVKALIKSWKQIANRNDSTTTTTTTTATTTTTTTTDDDVTTKKTKSKTNVPPLDSDTKINNGKLKQQQQQQQQQDDDDDDDDDHIVLPTTIDISKAFQHLQETPRISFCQKLYIIFQKLEKKLIHEEQYHPNSIPTLLYNRSIEMEHAIYTLYYNRKHNDKKGYADKARSLLFNLNKNMTLTKSIVLGSISCPDVVQYTTEQLANEQMQLLRQETTQKLIDSKRLDWNEANEDKINNMCGIKGDLLNASLFTCGRCKSIKTTSTQKQTRSADEPMTVFVLCLNCGKRWKC